MGLGLKSNVGTRGSEYNFGFPLGNSYITDLAGCCLEQAPSPLVYSWLELRELLKDLNAKAKWGLGCQ